jgi:hypothetical protein
MRGIKAFIGYKTSNQIFIVVGVSLPVSSEPFAPENNIGIYLLSLHAFQIFRFRNV